MRHPHPAPLTPDPADGPAGPIETGHRGASRRPRWRAAAAVAAAGLLAVVVAPAAGAQTAPADCSRFSPLDCSTVAKPLPAALTFDGTAGGLTDRAGAGTGFTMVQPSSSGHYLPDRLTVDPGARTLTIASTAGVSYRTQEADPSANSQDDALGIGIAPTRGSQVQTTLVAPPAGTGGDEQGGVWLGPGQDDYVKLVVISAGGGQSKVQLLRESGGVSGPAADELDSAPAVLSASKVRLVLALDPVARTVSGLYSVAGGALQSVGTLTDVAANVFDDPEAGSVPGATTFAGVLTSSRTGTPDLSWTFSGFSVRQGFTASFDFGAQGSTPAPGSVRDYGLPYRARGGLAYGWVRAGSTEPVSLVGNGRSRTAAPDAGPVPDPRSTSFVHMQLPAAAPGVPTPGAWQLAVPKGVYRVTVGLGDAGTAVDSRDALDVEDQDAVAGFVPTPGDRLTTSTVVVRVTDGRLTLDPRHGSNTKIDFVDVAELVAGDAQPSVRQFDVGNRATGVASDDGFVADLRLPTGAVDPDTLTSGAVRLTEVETGAAVPVKVATSGGGDTINVTPDSRLARSTEYRLVVTDALTDLRGTHFLPYAITFTTASVDAANPPAGVAFDKVEGVASGDSFTSVAMGPDGRLYAGSITGTIYRWDVQPDGTLANQYEIHTVQQHSARYDSYQPGVRTVIGLAFDPGATADNPMLWVTTNAPFLGTADVPDLTGRVGRLSGRDLRTYTSVLTGLPRSIRDHETNSLAFGPDGALYISQGANTAMGAPDSTWGERSEQLLSSAVLRLDTAKLPAELPLDVRTADGGSYDPFAQGAPLTLYATGIRNAFDLVWHSNGHLYAPTNGSAAGGNAPASPAVLPASCTRRSDAGTNGAWTGPAVPGISIAPDAETDYVFDVHAGRYYGHPDPARCEWTLGAGNPTSGTDPFEIHSYPVGTQPDRNYDLADVYDAGTHSSADGAIEYRGSAFGGELDGTLMVVRYSKGQDVETFAVAPDGQLSDRAVGIPGLTGFDQPLDLTEDVATGNLYVTELGADRITLLRPHPAVDAAQLSVTSTDGTPFADRVVTYRIGSPKTDPPNLVHDTAGVRIADTGTDPMTVTSLDVTGPWVVDGGPGLPFTVAPGSSVDLSVRFTAGHGTVRTGSLVVRSSAAGGTDRTVQLAGIWQAQSEHNTEPTLAQVVQTFGYASAIPANMNSEGAVVAESADEVLAPYWSRTDPTQPVSVVQLAALHTHPGTARLSWYPQGSTSSTSILRHDPDSAQSLLPWLYGSTSQLATASFAPTSSVFGLKVDGESSDPTRNDSAVDRKNGCTAAQCGNHVRFFRVRDRAGALEPHTWLMVMDYSGINYDYNDNVYLLTGIDPAS